MKLKTKEEFTAIRSSTERNTYVEEVVKERGYTTFDTASPIDWVLEFVERRGISWFGVWGYKPGTIFGHPVALTQECEDALELDRLARS